MAVMPPWITVNYVGVDPTIGPDMTAMAIVEVEPAKPLPEIPPPCWDSRPIDAEACAAATRAMCGG